MPFQNLHLRPLNSTIYVLFSHIYCFSDPPSRTEYISYQLCLIDSYFATIIRDEHNNILEKIFIPSYIEFRRVYRSFSLYNASFSSININNQLFSNIIPFNNCPTGRRWGVCSCTPRCACPSISDLGELIVHTNICPTYLGKIFRASTFLIIPFRAKYHHDRCERTDFDYQDIYSSDSGSIISDSDSYHSARIY